MDMVRSMMGFTNLPPSFWGYALETTAMLLNKVHTKAVEKTPYKIWMGKPPRYSYLRIWKCPAYVKQAVRDKLDSRSILYYFMGYTKNSIRYYYYNFKKIEVFVSRYVTFLEKEFLLNRKGRMIELEEVRENSTIEIIEHTPQQPVEQVHTLRRSDRVSRPPIRYGLLFEGNQKESNHGYDPRSFKEAISDIDSTQ